MSHVLPAQNKDVYVFVTQERVRSCEDRKQGHSARVNMIIIKSYGRRVDETGRVYILSYEFHVCPVCGCVLAVIGTRERRYFDNDDTKVVLVIRRLRCKGCRVIHHELPDILIPYKRHCADTVEYIVNGENGNVCCDDRTIARIRAWWEACRLYFENALASLREKYGLTFQPNPTPREIVRAVANAHLWPHTRTAFLPG